MKKLSVFLISVFFFAQFVYAADVAINDQTELEAAPAENDILPIYDTDATAGKRITVLNLLNALESALTGFEIHADNLPATDAELAAIAGLTFADASVIQLTGAAAAAVLTSGGANRILGSNSDNTALEFKTSITGVSAALLPVTFDDVDGSATGDISAAQASRTLINSYGRSGAVTLTLPAAAEGMTFIALVGTQHNSAWKIQRAGSDTITWSTGGTDTTGKTYFQETNQPVGSRLSCITYRSGASAYTWLCGSITGRWVTD